MSLPMAWPKPRSGSPEGAAAHLPLRMRHVRRLVVLLGILNFAAFVAGCALLGGDAWSGAAVAGHYFLGNSGHYREVGPAVFVYSWWHRWIAFAGLFAALVAGWSLKWTIRERGAR